MGPERNGTTGTNKKLNPKWASPYKPLEVIRDGGTYLLENIFTSEKVQREAEKIKPYIDKEQSFFRA